MNRQREEEGVSLQQLRECKLVVKCFLNYCRQHPEEVDVLFRMVSIFALRTTIDYSFLKDFYQIEVAEVPNSNISLHSITLNISFVQQGYTLAQKKVILSRFVGFFIDPTEKQEHKVKVLQILIIPMLTASFLKKEDISELMPQNVMSYLFAFSAN